MIAKVRNQDLDVVKANLEMMCNYVCENEGQDDVEYLVKQLKIIVPEFKSQNSRFECLDEEIEKCSVS